MKRISVYISEPQHAAYHALAGRKGVGASELMRQALDEYLARNNVEGSPPLNTTKKKAARRRAGTRRRA